MDNNTHVRVRFAPSPTGFMHLGNVRSALLNYLFARHYKGTFILRIEDTDVQRNIPTGSERIIQDLAWLQLTYDEGPGVGGPYAPYYQSQRGMIYHAYLDTLQEKNSIYRCFCTPEELEKRRIRQLALKMPPKYDRTCLHLSPERVQQLLQENIPFIWRFKLNDQETVTFYDLAHKMMHFELKHFSDTPLTRQDGSFTFLFANFVDDAEMRITHVLRGEDHLTNTAVQIAFYRAFAIPTPVFWHLPIICNKEGKKLSKRDFGFSLTDLKNGGFLPEAIGNYLAIIGGSFEHEIMPLNQIAQVFPFDTISPTGPIRYDLEKLRWVNHHWIMQYDTYALAELCRPFLQEAYPTVNTLTTEQLTLLIAPMQQELVTLKESVDTLAFYFKQPELDPALLAQYDARAYQPFLRMVITEIEHKMDNPDEAIARIQALCKEHSIPMRTIFALMRIALTGKPQGSALKDIIMILGSKEAYARLQRLAYYQP